MLSRIVKLFESPAVVVEEQPDPQERVRLATCALLVEMARVDDDFSEKELGEIVRLLCEHFDLAREDAGELIEAARKELQDSVELWRFTNLINTNFSIDEKLRVIEMVWRVVFADGILDKYEDHLVHKLAKLLNLTHRQLIDAKLRALGKGGNS